MLAEIGNWLVAVLALITATRLALWIWTRCTPSVVWLAYLICVLVLLMTYALKALEISIGPEPFRLEWGIGRRWGDVSHWFTVLLVATAWIPAVAASWSKLRLPGDLRFPYVLAAGIGCVLYLGLVRATTGTFFFRAPFFSFIKWIQFLEGALTLLLICAAQMFLSICFIVLVDVVNRLRDQVGTLVTVLAAFLTALLSISAYVLIKAPEAVKPVILHIAGDMPGREQEIRGPATTLVVYQVLFILVLPLLMAGFISWIYGSRRQPCQ